MLRPRARANAGNSGPENYAGLGERLVLLDWLHDLLGYQNTRRLLEDIEQAQEGFDPMAAVTSTTGCARAAMD